MDILQRLKSSVKKQEIVKLASDMVKLHSCPGSKNYEKDVAEFIYNVFKKEGIDCELKPILGERPNIIARLPGKGKGRSLMLTGHTDTVPAYEMSDPFSGKVKNNRIYGRGSVDMKGPLAAMIMAVIGLKRAGIRLDGDLIFTGVINEEYKSEGTEDLVKNGPKTDAAIVGKPTDLKIAAGHRGLEWLEMRIKGKTAHGGTASEGINAISKAAKFIRKVEEDLMPRFKEREHDLIGPPTLNFGVIKGGTQPSSVAGECLIQIDRRWTPLETLDQVFGDLENIISELEKEDPEFKATIHRVPSNMATMDHAPMEISTDHPLVKHLEQITEDILGIKSEIISFPGWTDASLLSNFADIETVVFGPGDLARAHSENEFIEIDQLYQAYFIYGITAYKFCM